MNIVFMGTPDFAVPCLERIVSDGHKVSAVFTRADKPVGRKKVLTSPPVKVAAEKLGLKVYQPEKIRGNEEVYSLLSDINPDVIVVVAYGRILPNEILNLPKYGCVNVHGSLLPRHRGASPIQWSIVCGDKKTGVTTMLMDEGIDTGDMLLTEEIEITDNDTYETLHDKMSVVGANTLSITLDKLLKGEITPKKQPSEGANYAPIITKQMGQLDFSKTANELYCLIRGFTPWPLAYFYFEGRRFKIYGSKMGERTSLAAGTVYYKQNRMFISCADGSSIEITEICPDGSKKMDISAFKNGRFIEEGAVLEFKAE